MNLSKGLDLNLAWRRVKRDSHSDFILSPFEFDVYDARAAKGLAVLEKKIDSQYHFNDAVSIEVPKPGFTLRPGAILTLEDRIVYRNRRGTARLADTWSPTVGGCARQRTSTRPVAL